MPSCNSPSTAFNPSTLPSLSGKVFLITGANAGIGYQTALHLARAGATVYMGCRSTSRGSSAIESIRSLVPSAKLHLLLIDHMSLSSVVSATNELKQKEGKLHGLINNAGIMAVPFEKSKDGWESQWQTNFLSHWLLTQHLLPLLRATAKASQPGEVRIVNVTSGGHTFAPKVGIDFEDINQERGGVWSRYGQSKLANILHAKELNKMYGPGSEVARKGDGEIWTAAVHSGNVYSDLSKNAKFLGPLSAMFPPVLNLFGAFIPADRGAYASVFCASSQAMKAEVSGEYFVPLGKVGKPSKHAQNMEIAEKLWQWTEDEMKGKGYL